MNVEKRLLMKLLSLLLHYPDETLVEAFEELEEAVTTISRPEAKKRCQDFLDRLKALPLVHLQEEYTATFDLSPETCLNLTHHRCGDTRERGRVLVELQQLYNSGGYESTVRELPDYLPLLLEFLSLDTGEGHSAFLGQYCEQVEEISSRLQRKASAYAALFRNVVDIFKELKADGA